MRSPSKERSSNPAWGDWPNSTLSRASWRESWTLGTEYVCDRYETACSRNVSYLFNGKNKRLVI